MKVNTLTNALLVFLSVSSFIILILLIRQTVQLQKSESYTKLLKQGDKAYLFEATDIAGKPVNINKKPAVLVFFSLKCGACERKNHYWESLYNKYGQKVLLVGICADSPVSMKQFIQRHNLTFPFIYDGDNYLTKKYRIQWFPTLVLITLILCNPIKTC